MKKIFFLIVTLIIMLSCKNDNEMNVEATITGLKKGTVYLQKIKDTTLINLDSIIVNGQDKITLSTTIDKPELYYVYVDKVDGTEYNDRVTFFGERGEIKLNTHLDKINSDVVIIGSESDNIYKKYLKSVKKINREIGILNIDIINAQFNNKNDVLRNYNEKLSSLIKSKYLIAIQFALNNKKSPVAAYIASREIPNTNTKYLDSIYKGLSKEAKQTIYGKELSDLVENKN